MISIDHQLTERNLKTRMILRFTTTDFEVPSDETAEVEALGQGGDGRVIQLKVRGATSVSAPTGRSQVTFAASPRKGLLRIA